MTTIERREKITRNWRPAGEPARRMDDFAEIPHLAVAAAPPTAAAKQDERREIGARLENWARYYTQSERQIEVSPTGRIIERAKLAAGIVEDGTNERRAFDEYDAMIIERTMRHLTTQHRMLLWWCYIRQAQPEMVCRKMSIAHRPATAFVNLFRQAQAAVESVADKSKPRQA